MLFSSLLSFLTALLALDKCECESTMHFKRDCSHALKNKRDSVLQATDIDEDDS